MVGGKKHPTPRKANYRENHGGTTIRTFKTPTAIKKKKKKKKKAENRAHTKRARGQEAKKRKHVAT